MRARWLVLGGLVAVLAWSGGCINVKAPERITVTSGEAPPPVDSSRVPQPATLDEAKAELQKAYQNIQYLEHQNTRLQEKADKYKRERDDCRKRLKKYEDD